MPAAVFLILPESLDVIFIWMFRKTEEQKPREQKPKANENKPVMTE